MHAQLLLHHCSGSGEGHVGGGGRQDNEIDVADLQPGILEGLATGRGGQIGCILTLGCNVPLLDAGALLDPFVRGIDKLGQVVIGHYARWEIGPDAADNRSLVSHAGLASGSGTAAGGAGAFRVGKRRMPSAILSITRLRAIS